MKNQNKKTKTIRMIKTKMIILQALTLKKMIKVQ